PSSDDAALLASTGVETYAWQTVNLAAQAQQRMGNDGSTSLTDVLGDTAPVQDETVYISGSGLKDNATNADTKWAFKPGFGASDDNMSSLASYLNTSGQNLLIASAQLSLGASSDGTTIDPLTAVTTVSSGGSMTAGTTTFTFPTGTVAATATSAASTAATSGDLGNIFSDISHALSDALHWLQHVADQVYKDLAQGAVAMEVAANSITATVSADIMKAINGVDQELQEVLSTVEAYANVIANLVVTIVEQSFIYKLIEALIKLIELLFHLADILALNKSLQALFTDMRTGSNGKSWPQISSGFTSWNFASGWIGNDNISGSGGLGGVDTSQMQNEVDQAILSAVLGNPLTRKIIDKLTGYVAKAEAEISKDLPLTFNMDSSVVSSMLSGVNDLADELFKGAETITVDILEDLVEDLVDNPTDPKATFETMAGQLGNLAEVLVRDEIEPLFDFADEQVANTVDYAGELLGSDTFLTLNVAELADLFVLFEIGDAGQADVKVSAADAVFFPMAIIMWVTNYVREGKSASSVSQLDSSLDADDLGGSVPDRGFFYGVLAVGWLADQMRTGVWLVDASSDESNRSGGSFETVWLKWFYLLETTSDLLYTASTDNDAWEDFYSVWRVCLALNSVVAALPNAENNVGTGWATADPTTLDVLDSLNALFTVITMAVDAVTTIEDLDSSADEAIAITLLVGRVLSLSPDIIRWVYDVLNPSGEATLPYVALGAFALTYLGAGTQAAGAILSTSATEDADDPDTGGSGSGGSGSGGSGPGGPGGSSSGGSGGTDNGSANPPAGAAEPVPGRVNYTG
ncbi:MAG: hypothetical protein WA991_12320, partial [Ornithinimicrobium sp.]